MEILRIKLGEITDNVNSSIHTKLIEKLNSECAHSIEVVEDKTSSSPYTCVVHALRLVDNTEYMDIVLAAPSYVHANTSFIQRLISKNILIETEKPVVGDLIVYFDFNCVKHIGVVLDDEFIESKWGIGQLYKHKIFEVPAQYGEQVKYYKHISVDAALDEFVSFAKENGVEFE